MLRVVLTWALVLFSAMANAAPSFVIGVLPVHSSRVLVDRYEPLRSYLEKRLKQPVLIETAPDFARFHGRTMRGDFDLVITAVHFARLAQKESGYHPLAQFHPDHDALLIVNEAHPLRLPQGIKGKKLAVIDPLAITVMAVLSHFEQQGLEAGEDFKVESFHSHAGVAHALMSGMVDTAVTTSQGLLQIPEDLRRKIVVARHIADIPAFVFLVKPDMPETRIAQIGAWLLAFAGEEEGLEFFGRTGYVGLRPASESQLKRADVYLKQTRKLLKP